MCFDPSHYRPLNCGERSFNPHSPQRIVGNGSGASHLGTGTQRRHLCSRHVLMIGRAGPAVFSYGVYFAIALFHCLAPNESRGL